MAGLDPIGVIPPGALIGPTGGLVDGLRMHDHKLNSFDIDNILVSLSTTEFRVVVPDHAATPTGDFGITLQNGSDAPMVFDIGEVGLYDVTNKTVKAPPSYKPYYVSEHNNLNGNTVVNNGLVEADGDALPLTPAQQVTMHPARTNRIAYSWDLTNAAWTETGTTVAALDAVGMDGLDNSACTLTDDDGAAYESITHSETITSGWNAHTCRVFVKKDTDQTRFPEVAARLTGGTPQSIGFQINTETGVSAVRSSNAISSAEVRDGGRYWEVLVSVSDNNTGNVNFNIDIFPARGIVLGNLDTSATGSIVVGNVEFHEYRAIRQIRGTSPIFTDGAAAGVDSDAIEVTDWDNIAPNDEGLMLLATTSPAFLMNTAEEQLVSSGSSNYIYRGDWVNGFISYNGTVFSNRNAGSVSNEECIVALIWSERINAYSIGYYYPTSGTFNWDYSPAPFSGFNSGSVLDIMKDLKTLRTIRSLLIYDGIPIGSDSLEDVQDWVEANAESEILSRQA